MKRALIVGCSARVWADVEAAHDLCPQFDTYYLVKFAGIRWDGGRFVWVTLHPEFMRVDKLPPTTMEGNQPGYVKQRAALGLHSDYEIVSPLTTEVGMHGHHKMDRHTTYRWPGMSGSGSSGFFAVKVALEDDGHDVAVLAGVPMEQEAGHFTRKKPWLARDSFLIPWTSHKKYYAEKTRSLSGGWTEQELGRPTLEWLGISSGTKSSETLDGDSERLQDNGTKTSS